MVDNPLRMETIPAQLCDATDAPGGADRDRTDDPLLAKQVLSQLSYSPRSTGKRLEVRRRKVEVRLGCSAVCLHPSDMVGGPR
jgi:hypothetical protein